MAQFSWLQWEEETDQAYKGFKTYMDLGPKRSSSDVARAMKLSKSSVDNWSANFRWRDRIRDFENHVAMAETDGLVNQVAEMRDANIALMDKLRGLLDLRLDDFILARKDPTVGWTQALMAMAKIESNALLLGDRAQQSKTSEQIVKVEQLMADLDAKIQGSSE